MKASLILIRAVFVLTAIFGFLFGAKAEIFIGSSTNVNSLVVASNEVILISAIRNENFYSYYFGEINLNGTTQEVAILDLTSHKYALAGPAILSFPYISFPNLFATNSYPVCVSFQRIRGTSIQSVFFSTNTTTTIQVPAGKTCHLFAPFPSYANYPPSGYYPTTAPLISVQTGSDVVSNIFFFGGEEFSGPAAITFGNYNQFGSLAYVISFYQTDDALNLPSGVLQGSTGSFVITVEKSADLAHWSPVMIQATGDDQAAFYRLNFSH